MMMTVMMMVVGGGDGGGGDNAVDGDMDSADNLMMVMVMVIEMFTMVIILPSGWK